MVVPRILGQSATLIDNIFINKYAHEYKTAVIYNDLSDHMPIALKLDVNNGDPAKVQKSDKRSEMFLNQSETILEKI